jgi:hypothetical protein
MISAEITIVSNYKNEQKVLDKEFENNRHLDKYLMWMVSKGIKIIGVETKYKLSEAEELLKKALGNLSDESLSLEIESYLKSKETQS